MNCFRGNFVLSPKLTTIAPKSQQNLGLWVKTWRAHDPRKLKMTVIHHLIITINRSRQDTTEFTSTTAAVPHHLRERWKKLYGKEKEIDSIMEIIWTYFKSRSYPLISYLIEDMKATFYNTLPRPRSWSKVQLALLNGIKKHRKIKPTSKCIVTLCDVRVLSRFDDDESTCTAGYPLTNRNHESAVQLSCHYRGPSIVHILSATNGNHGWKKLNTMGIRLPFALQTFKICFRTVTDRSA